MNDRSNNTRPMVLRRVGRFIVKTAATVAIEEAIRKVYSDTIRIIHSVATPTPVATAPLPPPLRPSPRLPQIQRFDWPIDLSSYREIQYLDPALHLQPALYFYLQSDGSKPLSIKATSGGIVTDVFHVKPQLLEPMFGIFVRHTDNVYSLYWGHGTSVVRPKMFVKRSQEIARLAPHINWLYFEMAQGQQFIDPRPYFPLLPRVSEIEANHVIRLPGVMYLWLWHCEVLNVDPNQIHAWRQQLQAEFVRSLIPDDRR